MGARARENEAGDTARGAKWEEKRGAHVWWGEGGGSGIRLWKQTAGANGLAWRWWWTGCGAVVGRMDDARGAVACK